MSELKDFCAAVKAPTVGLMASLFDLQRDPTKAADVVAQVDAILDAQRLWPSGLVGHVWATQGSETLRGIKAAANAGDGARAWELFASQESGLHLLGELCRGQEGW
ncbi:hypothetical protein ON058_02855 [Demequina sp. B12]|uniref:hypothetical protein n=1 Tax=Demequina sp. B12 TaxID=2992757 RepID=UPI00237A16A6|nr:hypothetical protein [Demequina sp. B12]MDE0572350.1 hypothetical protein [Demequina sp. B12]